MKLLFDKETIQECNKWYLLLDNDFISELFRDEIVSKEFLSSFKESFFLIDPLIEFEFLRDIFEPKQRLLRESFISKPFFYPVSKNQEVFVQLQKSALFLSKLYSHQGLNKKHKISIVDLFLGARCMISYSSTMIITGNKKDFPNSIFDLVSVLNIEQNDGSIKPYSIVRFNPKKYDFCRNGFNEMEKKYKQQLKQEEKINLENFEIPF